MKLQRYDGGDLVDHIKDLSGGGLYDADASGELEGGFLDKD